MQANTPARLNIEQARKQAKDLLKARALESAVFLAAFTLAIVACGDGQSAPSRASMPSASQAPTAAAASMSITAPTPLSVPTQTPMPTSVPAAIPVAVSVSTPTPSPLPTVPTQTPKLTSVPTQVPTPTSIPTPMPAAVSVSTPTPEPLPTPAPVPTQTATPGAAPTYLTQEIPPCTPAPGSSVDPCEPGAKGTLITESGSLSIMAPPLLVEDLVSFPVSVHTTHIALRGTYLPSTVRCTSGHQLRGPLYVGRGQASYGLFIYCFADVRVNAYLLGTGPSTLTVVVEKSLYTRRGIYDDDDYGLEQLEGRRLAYERALAEGGRFEYDGSPRRGNPRAKLVVTGPPGGIGGREVVLFIGPSIRTSVEAWEVFWTWDVERRDDGTVVALHPYREWFTRPFEQSYAEIELPALTQAVTAAHQARVAANGGRIGEDTGLPMLVTDANRLRQYFSDPKVGGYAPGVPTPEQPPPVPPVVDSSSYSFDVAEDAEIGTVVGTVSATDPAMDTVTYSISAGNEDAKFAIDTNTGAIAVAGVLDYESDTSYSLTVEASNEGGGSATATVEISVTDVSPKDLAMSLADGTFTITWSSLTALQVSKHSTTYRVR